VSKPKIGEKKERKKERGIERKGGLLVCFFALPFCKAFFYCFEKSERHFLDRLKAHQVAVPFFSLVYGQLIIHQLPGLSVG